MLSLYSWICHLSPSSLTSAHIHPLKKQKFDSFFRLKNQKIQNTLMMNLRRSEHVDVFLQNCKSFPPDPFPSSFLGYDFTTCLHASRWCNINSGTLKRPHLFPIIHFTSRWEMIRMKHVGEPGDLRRSPRPRRPPSNHNVTVSNSNTATTSYAPFLIHNRLLVNPNSCLIAGERHSSNAPSVVM